MNKIHLTMICLLAIIMVRCQYNERKKEISIEKQNEINAYLKTEVDNTLGLAIAIIKDGDMVYENYLGKEDLNNKLVAKESIFPLYSLSKLITSTAVFQLIEDHKINLNDKISMYIDSLPKEWGEIEVKNLLTHSSGLPDYDVMAGEISDRIIMENLIQKELRFKKGERWEYNQTNFWFITKIIEQVTKRSYESFVVENQFLSAAILFSSNFTDSIPNRSFKYSFNTDTQNWEKLNFDFGKRANSAGGINLTLNQFVAWSQRLDNNEFMKPATKRKMWTSFTYEIPFYFESEKDQFLYGWQQYATNQEVSYGFTGGMVTGYRTFIHQDITIILLTNGLKNSPIRNKVINKIASIMDDD